MDFCISASTDVGIKRPINQDSMFVRKINTNVGKMVFAVLCDGMGGLKYGEAASSSIVSGFTDWMYSSMPLLTLKNESEYGDFIKSEWEYIASVQNDKIHMFGMQNGCLTGSTLTVMLLTENRYYLMNIGDTRAYEISDRSVQLTEDHTIAANEIKLGNMTELQAETSPAGSVLTRCVGVQDSIYADFFIGSVKDNAVYILCSDGFRHRITGDEIKENLYSKIRNDLSSIKLQEEYLIDLNKSRGEKDNISVITIVPYNDEYEQTEILPCPSNISAIRENNGTRSDIQTTVSGETAELPDIDSIIGKTAFTVEKDITLICVNKG